MKKVFTNRLVVFGVLSSILLTYACGSAVEDASGVEKSAALLELGEYGIEASVDLAGSEVKVIDTESKYEQKLLPNKKLEIKTDENYILVISECQENGVEMKVEFAEGFGETVVEKGEDYCIILQEDEDGNPVYDVSLFIEKDGAFVELKICDPETKAQIADLEIAKKGLEKAKSFKFS